MLDQQCQNTEGSMFAPKHNDKIYTLIDKCNAGMTYDSRFTTRFNAVSTAWPGMSKQHATYSLFHDTA